MSKEKNYEDRSQHNHSDFEEEIKMKAYNNNQLVEVVTEEIDVKNKQGDVLDKLSVLKKSEDEDDPIIKPLKDINDPNFKEKFSKNKGFDKCCFALIAKNNGVSQIYLNDNLYDVNKYFVYLVCDNRYCYSSKWNDTLSYYNYDKMILLFDSSYEDYDGISYKFLLDGKDYLENVPASTNIELNIFCQYRDQFNNKCCVNLNAINKLGCYTPTITHSRDADTVKMFKRKAKLELAILHNLRMKNTVNCTPKSQI